MTVTTTTAPLTLTVEGSKGALYTVTLREDLTAKSCSCPGWYYRRSCRHTADLLDGGARHAALLERRVLRAEHAENATLAQAARKEHGDHEFEYEVVIPAVTTDQGPSAEAQARVEEVLRGVEREVAHARELQTDLWRLPVARRNEIGHTCGVWCSLAHLLDDE